MVRVSVACVVDGRVCAASVGTVSVQRSLGSVSDSLRGAAVCVRVPPSRVVLIRVACSVLRCRQSRAAIWIELVLETGYYA